VTGDDHTATVAILGERVIDARVYSLSSRPTWLAADGLAVIRTHDVLDEMYGRDFAPPMVGGKRELVVNNLRR
jgi:hypothetical protein